MTLRYYQENLAVDAMRSDSRHVLIVAPTGAGKTRIVAQIAYCWPGPIEVVAPWISLADQLRDTLPDFGGRLQVFGPGGLKRPRAPGTLLILDEAHRFDTTERKRLIERGLQSKTVGVTATAFGPRGPLQWDAVIFGPSPAALAHQGYLSWPRYLPFSAAQSAADRPGPGIAFSRTIEGAKKTAKRLGLVPYHSLISRADRDHAIDAYRSGAIAGLSAVGAIQEGFDSRVDWVELPRTLSAREYVQIVGRCIRPGSRAVIYDPHAVSALWGRAESLPWPLWSPTPERPRQPPPEARLSLAWLDGGAPPPHVERLRAALGLGQDWPYHPTHDLH